jgi:hypothetical protein
MAGNRFLSVGGIGSLAYSEAMAAQYGKRTFRKDRDRLHPRLNNLAITNAAVIIATFHVLKGSGAIEPGHGASFNCKQVPVSIGLPVDKALETALADKIPDAIEVNIGPNEPELLLFGPWSAGIQASPRSKGLRNIFPNVITPVFVEFYESYKRWLIGTFGQSAQWPPVWRFARVIRNSISHGARVKIERPNDPPVTWYGLTYSFADNGAITVGCDLAPGDLLLLLLELSDELDAAGCTF